MLLNAERARWEAAGITVGCAPAERLLAAFDKAATVGAAAACGVRAPRTVVPASREECALAAATVGFPCVVKSRLSYVWDGSRVRPKADLAFLTRPEDLDAVLAAHPPGEPWPIFQEVVRGRGCGVFGLCDDGRVVAWFAHEALRHVRPMATPSTLRRSAPLDPRLREPAERLLSHMRWHGPVMVEFLDGEGGPWLMEVNGRFWNSLALAVAAGVDFPLLWVRLLTGEPVTSGPAYREGVTVRWLWGDVKRALGAILVDGPPVMLRPTAWRTVRDVFHRSPRGTRFEMWDPADPWPAVGEWVEAMREVWGWVGRQRSPARPGSRPTVTPPGARS